MKSVDFLLTVPGPEQANDVIAWSAFLGRVVGSCPEEFERFRNTEQYKADSLALEQAQTASEAVSIIQRLTVSVWYSPELMSALEQARRESRAEDDEMEIPSEE